MTKITITGNCQVAPLAKIISLIMPEAAIQPVHLGVSRVRRLDETIESSDIWLRMLPAPADLLHLDSRARVIDIPAISFPAFFPDLVYATKADGTIFRGQNDYHSAVGLWAWKQGLPPSALPRLLDDEVLASLGYLDFWEPALKSLKSAFAQSDLSFKRVWRRLNRMGVFMHTVNHPTIAAMAVVAEEVMIAAKLWDPGKASQIQGIVRTIDDPLAHTSWPVYPVVGRRLGLPGSFVWRVGPHIQTTVEEWADLTWNAYGGTDPGQVRCQRLEEGHFQEVLSQAAKSL